ncbi:hypothetical protein CPB84DRAFT_1825085 [Gymnopilus junonius]|uniref:Uncharacterized protein n=1 Tax=Gymnopilus junonius TaxID=109634 RepID=A0A9P5NNL7_GYMJU|nr:hypothetical protein CPB84DRAFT_1825085 [Gymnopilus junonius]
MLLTRKVCRHKRISCNVVTNPKGWIVPQHPTANNYVQGKQMRQFKITCRSGAAIVGTKSSNNFFRLLGIITTTGRRSARATYDMGETEEISTGEYSASGARKSVRRSRRTFTVEEGVTTVKDVYIFYAESGTHDGTFHDMRKALNTPVAGLFNSSAKWYY